MKGCELYKCKYLINNKCTHPSQYCRYSEEEQESQKLATGEDGYPRGY